MAQKADLQEDFSRALEPVREWATSITKLPVVHDFDEEHTGDGAVLLRPLEIALAPASGPVMRHVSSSELMLDLLVTTIGLPVFEAAGVTSGLALSANVDSDWMMDAGGASLELWRALDRPPAPAFILRIPVRRLVVRSPAPLVREPVRIIPAQQRVVVGRVVASDGRPLAAARVALADTGEYAISDHRGWFRLPVATVTGVPLTLSVAARGASVTLSVETPPVDAGGNLGDLTLPVPESV